MNNTLCLRLIALCILSVPVIASAALGGKPASAQAGLHPLNATTPNATKTGQAFTVQQYQDKTGTTIKEFITPAGIVFAVTWSGPLMPDMQQLLGQYFTDYVNAAKQNHGSHTHLDIHQAGLVVQAAGYMRAFSGIAYVPSLMPPGVTVAQLK
ncbi:MAG: DUF2844 domain-containing protein [Gammaproteobacteria bacterium]